MKNLQLSERLQLLGFQSAYPSDFLRNINFSLTLGWVRYTMNTLNYDLLREKRK